MCGILPETDLAALVVPGLGDSGPGHWQTRWEELDPQLRRVHQADWHAPALDDWLDTLDRAIAAAPGPVVLIAHSLGCALVAHWAQHHGRTGRVAGALLVAPADVDTRARILKTIRGFAPLPLFRLPFPSLVVASSDDPYVDDIRAELFAETWGSKFVKLSAAGHINAASGLDDWPQGQQLLRALIGRISEAETRRLAG